MHRPPKQIFAIRVNFRVKGERSEHAASPIEWAFEQTTAPTSIAQVVQMVANDRRVGSDRVWGAHNLIIEKVEAMHPDGASTNLDLK